MKNFKNTYFEVLFIIGLILSLIVAFDQSMSFLPKFIKGLFTSLSVMLVMVAGIVRFSKGIKEKLKVADNDERIKTIEAKSSLITLYAILFLSVICIIVFGFIGEPYILIAIVLAMIMFVGMLVMFIAKLVLSKRM